MMRLVRKLSVYWSYKDSYVSQRHVVADFPMMVHPEHLPTVLQHIRPNRECIAEQSRKLN